MRRAQTIFSSASSSLWLWAELSFLRGRSHNQAGIMSRPCTVAIWRHRASVLSPQTRDWGQRCKHHISLHLFDNGPRPVTVKRHYPRQRLHAKVRSWYQWTQKGGLWPEGWNHLCHPPTPLSCSFNFFLNSFVLFKWLKASPAGGGQHATAFFFVNTLNIRSR